MKSFLHLLTLATAISIPALTQQPATTPQNSPPPGNTSAEQQKNAASASKDNSGISGDQVTKPAGAKEQRSSVVSADPMQMAGMC